MQRIELDKRRGHLGISGKINPVLESDYPWVGFFVGHHRLKLASRWLARID